MHHKNFSLHWNFPKIEGNFSIFILLKFSGFMISRWLSKERLFKNYFYNILAKIIHIRQRMVNKTSLNIQGKGGRNWEARVCQAEQVGACLSLTFQGKVNGRNREELSSVGVKKYVDHIPHSWSQEDLPDCAWTEKFLRFRKGSDTIS